MQAWVVVAVQAVAAALAVAVVAVLEVVLVAVGTWLAVVGRLWRCMS